MTLPPEALLLRRMEGLLFQTAAIMRACAPWGRLLRELIEGGEPVGEAASTARLGIPGQPWVPGRPPSALADGRDGYLPGNDQSRGGCGDGRPRRGRPGRRKTLRPGRSGDRLDRAQP